MNPPKSDWKWNILCTLFVLSLKLVKGCISCRVNMKLLFTKNKLGVENRTLRLGDLLYWLVVEHKNRVKDHRIECSHWLPLKPFCIPNGNPKFTFKIVFTQFFSRICWWMCLPQKWTLGQELIIECPWTNCVANVFLYLT